MAKKSRPGVKPGTKRGPYKKTGTAAIKVVQNVVSGELFEYIAKIAGSSMTEENKTLALQAINAAIKHGR